MIFIFTTIRKNDNRKINRLLINASIDNNNNIINNEQKVNNLENATQNNSMRNNDDIPAMQIPREENENHSNSNTNSPKQLNA